jgi:hypothetical protein
VAGADSRQVVFEEWGIMCCIAVYGGIVVFDVPERLEWRYDGLCVVVDFGNTIHWVCCFELCCFTHLLQFIVLHTLGEDCRP